MRIYPALPKSVARGGQGNSVNNDCQGCQAKTLTGQGGRPYGQFAPGITPIDNDPNWNNHFCQFCCRTYWKGPIKKWQGEMPLGCFECVCGLNHQPGVSGPGIRPGGGNGGSLPPVEGQGPPAGSSPSPGVPGGGVGVSRPGNPSVPGYPPRNNCCDNIPATMECKDDPNSSRACSILAYFQLPTPQELCKDWLSGVSYFCNQALEMCIVLALAGILGLGDELQNQIAGVLISILGGTADDPHHVLSPDNWIAIILSGLLAILSRLEVPGIGEVTMTLILAAIACCFLAWIKCKEIAQRGYCTNRAKIPPKIDWAGNYCLNASPGSGGPGILLPPGLGGPIHGVAL